MRVGVWKREKEEMSVKDGRKKWNGLIIIERERERESGRKDECMNEWPYWMGEKAV